MAKQVTFSRGACAFRRRHGLRFGMCSAGRRVQRALALSTALVMVPYVLQAQDGAAGADASVLEEVVVTGSRIRGVAPVGSPTIGLDREDMTRSASSTIADLLKEVPQVVGYGIDETSFTASGVSASNASRATAINLRGLSPVATLVLLNGHRVTQSGTAGAFVDVSSIPVAAVGRVEIVADGASALYGSDAVAGVVNVILRRDFTGAETTFRLNAADSYQRPQFSQLLGHHWDSGRAMVAYEYSENNSLNSSERSFWSQDQRPRGGDDFRQTNCYPGTIVLAGETYAIPESTGGSIDPASLVPGTQNICDNSIVDIIPKQRRHSGVFSVEQELTERFTVSAEGYYSRKNLEPRFAAQGSVSSFATLNVPSSNAYFVAPEGTSPAQLAVQHSFYQEAGLRSAKGASETYSGVLQGRLDLASEWQLNAAAGWGQNYDFTESRTINPAALNAALASSDPDTALNPFGPGTNPAVYDSIFTGLFIPAGRNTMSGGELRADGPLFDVAGGSVRMAAGSEYRRYSLGTDTTRGNVAAPSTVSHHNTREVVSGYAEFFIPVVGAGNARPGIDRLDLSIAGRYDDYSDFGSTFNPKFGVTWGPTDALSLRATYGTSFRAPALSDLASPGSANNVFTANDPQSPTGTSTGITIRAGNPDLEPESARTITFGADWDPVAVPGLTLGATYFSIEYKDRIDGLGPAGGQALLQEDVYAHVLIRNPTEAQIQEVLNNGLPLGGLGGGVLPPTVDFIVDARPQNQGETVARGLDFQSSYRWRAGTGGDWRVGAVGTYYTTYKSQQTSTAPVLERVGAIGFPVRFRARANVGWSLNGFDASAHVNHVDSYRDINFTPARSVSSFTTFDVHLAYEFSRGPAWLDGVRTGLNVANLFDTDPPFVNSVSGYDAGQASPYGRLISAFVTMNW